MVTEPMWIEERNHPRFDEFRRGCIGIDDADRLQMPRHPLLRPPREVCPALPRPHSLDGAHLHVEDRLVKRALVLRKGAACGVGARDVRCVPANLSAGVNEHEVTVAHAGRIGSIVQHCGVATRTHDCGVAEMSRSSTKSVSSEDALELKLVHAWLSGAPHFDVSLSAYCDRSFEARHLRRRFDGTRARQNPSERLRVALRRSCPI
mmetsp:Transcript_17997/g.58747  ORF Transcript_17997/g.58747 Transcript_17997/m.58747 type:complete len:206 (+) Transcript_17997:2193-2810(+)